MSQSTADGLCDRTRSKPAWPSSASSTRQPWRHCDTSARVSASPSIKTSVFTLPPWVFESKSNCRHPHVDRSPFLRDNSLLPRDKIEEEEARRRSYWSWKIGSDKN